MMNIPPELLARLAAALGAERALALVTWYLTTMAMTPAEIVAAIEVVIGQPKEALDRAIRLLDDFAAGATSLDTEVN